MSTISVTTEYLATLKADLERARQELAEVTAELCESRRLQGELIAQIDEVTAERDRLAETLHNQTHLVTDPECEFCIARRQVADFVLGAAPCDCGQDTVDGCAQRPSRHCRATPAPGVDEP